MSGKKALFLFLAFMLPVCVFLFLKIFGKNEFAVKALYQDILPADTAGCNIHLPYEIPAEVTKDLLTKNDSLALIYFKKENPSRESINQITRVERFFKDYPVKIITADASSPLNNNKRCVFLMRSPYDMLLLDRNGLIRGQYVSYDLDEVDRLITEVDIILKKY